MLLFLITKMILEVIFDVETKTFFDEVGERDPGSLGVSIVSVYSRQLNDSLKETKGTMQSFWEQEFDKMWPIFQKAQRIIGFNSLGFDVPALAPYTNFPFNKLPHFDIMGKVKESFGRRISLNAIAIDTLGTKKSDHGSNAIKYYNAGDNESLAKLKRYCEDDVLITRDVYDYGLKHGHVKFKDKWNTLREVEIDFSHPEELFSSKSQESLF